jgi:hypothetical protein
VIGFSFPHRQAISTTLLASVLGFLAGSSCSKLTSPEAPKGSPKKAQENNQTSPTSVAEPSVPTSTETTQGSSEQSTPSAKESVSGEPSPKNAPSTNSKSSDSRGRSSSVNKGESGGKSVSPSETHINRKKVTASEAHSIANRLIQDADAAAKREDMGRAFGKSVEAWEVLQGHETDEKCADTLKKVEYWLRQYGEAASAKSPRRVDSSKPQFIE